MTDEPQKETPARKRGSNDDIWAQLGVEVNRELLEDLIFLRDLRERTQARRNMTWMALIGAFASAVIGALSVLLSNFFAHTGKLP
jgi:hypothetical protein